MSENTSDTNLVLTYLQQQKIPANLTGAQLCQLDQDYAELVHDIMKKLDRCIRLEPSRLMELLHAQPEEMLDQPQEAQFRVAHALLMSNPEVTERFNLDPVHVLSKLCMLKPHAGSTMSVYMDPAIKVVSWLDMSWQSFLDSTPQIQKMHFSNLHCQRMESRLLKLHERDRI